MAKELLSISIDAEVKKEILKRAKKQGRPKSYIANELLIKGIKI